MKFAFALVVFAVAASAALSSDEYEFLFTKWVAEHGKAYETEEFFNRFRVFKSNLDFIMEHNAGDSTYTMAMNKFGDLTWDEFKNQHMGYNHVQQPYLRSLNEFAAANDFDSSVDSIDWRAKGAVTGVKDQGQCGSCWSFSATGSLEGAHAIATGELVSLSEQQLVDCAGSAGNQGCNGGLMDSAFEWWIQNGGACAESDYPYTGRDGSCQRGCSPVAQISSYRDVRYGDESGIMSFITDGPVSIAIEADQSSFQFYSGGVFDGNCGTNLDHGVLIVGFGTDAGKDYWIVKNSWGGSWGESGYIRVIRDRNQCGLALSASQPQV